VLSRFTIAPFARHADLDLPIDPSTWRALIEPAKSTLSYAAQSAALAGGRG
jgi:hypothetical protein